MKHRYLVSTVTIIGSALVTLAPRAEPPAYGPGGVIDTVQEFISAVDQGSATAIARLLESKGRNGLYTLGEDGRFSQDRSGLAFYDISSSGGAVTSDTAKAFVAQQLTLGGSGFNRGLKTRIRSIRAECPSGEVSYEVIEFDREFSRGGRKVTQPMRATALLSHAGGNPDFRIFHWNASPIVSSPKLVDNDR